MSPLHCFIFVVGSDVSILRAPLTFLKNFGQIPRYVASLDGQMPHPLELQRGSNRLFKCTYSVINNWLLFGLIINRTEKPWLFYGIHLLMKKSSSNE